MTLAIAEAAAVAEMEAGTETETEAESEVEVEASVAAAAEKEEKEEEGLQELPPLPRLIKRVLLCADSWSALQARKTSKRPSPSASGPCWIR